MSIPCPSTNFTSLASPISTSVPSPSSRKKFDIPPLPLTVCQLQVPSPSSRRNLEPPVSPVDFSSVPSRSHEIVRSYGSASEPGDTSVQLTSIPVPSTIFTSLFSVMVTSVPSPSSMTNPDPIVFVSVALTVRVSPDIDVVTFVPPAIVRVSPGVMPVDPLSPATVVFATVKVRS